MLKSSSHYRHSLTPRATRAGDDVTMVTFLRGGRALKIPSLFDLFGVLLKNRVGEMIQMWQP